MSITVLMKEQREKIESLEAMLEDLTERIEDTEDQLIEAWHFIKKNDLWDKYSEKDKPSVESIALANVARCAR